MAEKRREDFVEIRARAGVGEVTHVTGNLVVRVSETKTQEVTRGEWIMVLEPLGVFELALPAPIASRPTKDTGPPTAGKE